MKRRIFRIKSEPNYYSDKRSLEILPKGKGFGMDFRVPGMDGIAYHTCVNEWGKEKIDGICAKYHRSVLSREALEADFLEFDEKYKPSIRDDPVYQLAFESVRKEWLAGPKIVPLTTGAVGTHKDTPRSKSAGLPYKMMGYKNKGEVFEDEAAMHNIRQMWHLIGAGVPIELPDCCLFARAQIARWDKEKIRSTWGYPMDVYVEEARFFLPLMDSLKREEFNPPIGYQVEMATGGMEYVDQMIKANSQGTIKVCDWSGFDKRVPPWLIRDAFSILSEKMRFDVVKDSEGKEWKVRPDRSRRRWKRIVDYYINTPVRMADGRRFRKHGGVPSGSCFTNIGDSLLNQIVQRYIVFQTTGLFPLAEIYQGDDSLTVEAGLVNLNDQAELALNKFGFKLNVAKSYTTKNPENAHFMGYYNLNGWPCKAQDQSIASYIFPEHRIRDPIITATRALGQLWCSFDPLWAQSWFRVLMDMMNWQGVEPAEIVHELHTNTGRYKFLRSYGFDLQTLTLPLPCMSGDGVWQVLPKPTPRKQYVKVVHDYQALWNDACAYWEEGMYEEEFEEWTESIELAQFENFEKWAKKDWLALHIPVWRRSREY